MAQSQDATSSRCAAADGRRTCDRIGRCHAPGFHHATVERHRFAVRTARHVSTCNSTNWRRLAALSGSNPIASGLDLRGRPLIRTGSSSENRARRGPLATRWCRLHQPQQCWRLGSRLEVVGLRAPACRRSRSAVARDCDASDARSRQASSSWSTSRHGQGDLSRKSGQDRRRNRLDNNLEGGHADGVPVEARLGFVPPEPHAVVRRSCAGRSSARGLRSASDEPGRESSWGFTRR